MTGVMLNCTRPAIFFHKPICVCRKGNAQRTSFLSNVWYQKLVLLFGVLGRRVRKIKKETALDRIGCPYWGRMADDIVVGKS